MRDLERHELSKLFGDLPADEYIELREDIRKNGLTDSVIVLADGKVLDGWHRYSAARELGRIDELTYVERNVQNGDLGIFVISKNLRRRHLSAGQRAQLVVAAYQWNTKNRQSVYSTNSTSKTETSDQRDTRPNVLVSAYAETRTEHEMANEAGVHVASIERAKAVERLGRRDEVIRGETTATAILQKEREKRREAEARAEAERQRAEEAERQREEARNSEKKWEDARQRRAENRRKRDQQLSQTATRLPTGEQKFTVIYADPPWRYDFHPNDAERVENHYPTMTLDDLMAMKPTIDKLAHTDCALYLWATQPKLPEALALMKDWGFEYKTGAIWDKETFKIGYWWRGQHELLLVGTRGSFPPPKAQDRVGSVIKSPRGKHSEKPAVFAEYIEQFYPDCAKIELFARTARDDWWAWGNEVGLIEPTNRIRTGDSDE